MLPDAPEPVACIARVRLLTMYYAVPEATFTAVYVLCNRVRLVGTREVKPQATRKQPAGRALPGRVARLTTSEAIRRLPETSRCRVPEAWIEFRCRLKQVFGQLQGRMKRIRRASGLSHSPISFEKKPSAQTRHHEERMSKPKVALVLSAGGMYGAYQAGVWDVLSTFFKPDLVVGASVGSLNGWLIASEAPGRALVEKWTSLDGIENVRFRLPSRPSEGCLETSLLQSWIEEMVGTTNPVTEYGLVANQFPILSPKLFRYPEVGFQHLMASCAVPGLLPMQRINGTLFADGGIVNPLPLWAAAEMGATAIVSVNVMGRRSAFKPSTAIPLLEINPSERLGPPLDCVYWDRTKAERWIDLGRRDAERQKHFVIECLEQSSRHSLA